MDYRQAFSVPESKYLRHIDLVGAPQTRTIVGAKPGIYDHPKHGPSEVVVVTLEPVPGFGDHLSCRPRLCKMIAKALGTKDMDQWSGKSLELFATEVDAYNKKHDVIGARAVEVLDGF